MGPLEHKVLGYEYIYDIVDGYRIWRRPSLLRIFELFEFFECNWLLHFKVDYGWLDRYWVHGDLVGKYGWMEWR